MKTHYLGSFIVILSFFFLVMCSKKTQSNSVYTELEEIVESIGKEHTSAFDKNIYEIEVLEHKGIPMLMGKLSVEATKDSLLQRVRELGYDFIDSIRLLPDETVGEKMFGVVNLSVADARVSPRYSAEMGTQLLLGMPVRVLEHKGWWCVKTAENYLAWLPQSSFVRMTKEDFNRWAKAEKIIFTDYFGFSFEMPNEKRQTVSDLVYGNILMKEGEEGDFYKVSYPDGRRAYVLKRQTQLYEKWLSSFELTGESIVQKALTLMGIPYSWGGTSVKGLDCSGFTKTVLLMHGIILLRNSSQQAQAGVDVDIKDDYKHLRAGDLMFFSRKKRGEQEAKIRHVAIYMGNKEFIHASGSVRINSLDPTKPNYEPKYAREFTAAKRIVNSVNVEGIWDIKENPLYREQE